MCTSVSASMAVGSYCSNIHTQPNMYRRVHARREETFELRYMQLRRTLVLWHSTPALEQPHPLEGVEGVGRAEAVEGVEGMECVEGIVFNDVDDPTQACYFHMCKCVICMLNADATQACYCQYVYICDVHAPRRPDSGMTLAVVRCPPRSMYVCVCMDGCMYVCTYNCMFGWQLPTAMSA